MTGTTRGFHPSIGVNRQKTWEEKKRMHFLKHESSIKTVGWKRERGWLCRRRKSLSNINQIPLLSCSFQDQYLSSVILSAFISVSICLPVLTAAPPPPDSHPLTEFKSYWVEGGGCRLWIYFKPMKKQMFLEMTSVIPHAFFCPDVSYIMGRPYLQTNNTSFVWNWEFFSINYIIPGEIFTTSGRARRRGILKV